MTDAPREGWYVAFDAVGRQICIERKSESDRLRAGWCLAGYPMDLPAGWTLGPRLDDLLADAARYRWLRKHSDDNEALWASQDGKCSWFFEFSVPAVEGESLESRAITWDEAERRIDTELAREKAREAGDGP